MERTTWLDGLRGLAAAIVAVDHYFMGGVLDSAFVSFWTDPPEENRRLIQLPPIRLLFAAHAMVSLFLVISGGDFLRRLSSAVTRRVFRIYLPVFVITAISQLLYFCNLFQWNFGDSTWGRQPWREPWAHVTFVFRYMVDNMNIIAFQGNPGLNGQLWTMGLEFRGSCIVYLTILGLAFWKPQLRRIAIGVLAAYWFYFGLWDIFGFLAGLYIAERRLAEHARTGEDEFKLPYHIPGPKLASIHLSSWFNYLYFSFGVYLVCLSDDGFLPTGYKFLELVGSSRWDGHWDVVSKCWKTAGSVMMVHAISKSPTLQRPLNSRPVQYLGKVSFSLYLVHQAVYHLVRDPVIHTLWYLATGTSYKEIGGGNASKQTAPFAFAWLVGIAIITPINLYVADLYTKHVDERCVRIARKIEKMITR
ncbi:acyltransferase 3 [Penicillium chermesinum]|nr:acyltransferase 3 [Penicillium chermesinum]